MSALKILPAVFLVLFLLSLIRVGGEAEYTADGALVRLRVGAFRVQVYPVRRPKREKKAKKERKKPEKAQSEPKPGAPMELARRFLPLVGEAAGALKRRIRIDRLFLDVTAGGRDAAAAALSFGRINGAVGMIWPIFEQNFDVRDHRIRTAVDFQSSGLIVSLSAAFSARLGQLISFAVRYGLKFFTCYRSAKSAPKQKEAI